MIARLLLVVILTVVSIPALTADAKGRIAAEVMSFHEGDVGEFALSPDRRTLFVVVSRGTSPKDPQRETWLSDYDVSEPAAPGLIAKIRLGGFATRQALVGGNRLFVMEWDDSLRNRVDVIDIEDPHAPKQIAHFVADYFHFDIADDGSCLIGAGVGSGPVTGVGYIIDADGHVAVDTCSTSGKNRPEYSDGQTLDKRGATELFKARSESIRSA